LLFRKTAANHAEIDNADAATAQVIINSFLEIGLDRIVGKDLAFINVTRDFIVNNHCRSLPPRPVVFEILEDTVPDRELTEALTSLREAGYRFALDDYDFSEGTRPLIPFCDFVKIDLRRVDRGTLVQRLPALQSFGLLAEKVETQEEYEFCKSLGFNYFQGYYFCKPRLISGAKSPLNRLAVFRLLAKLREPDVSARELERIVAEDVSLSYKLLQYLNSAYVGMKKRIESVPHAVRLIGMDQLRILATLLTMTGMDEKPRALAIVSLTRGKMCELLGRRFGGHNPEAFFTVGLFSTLDAFLDCTMNEALEKLPLSDDIRQGLLSREGPFGQVLQTVLAYERPDAEMTGIPLDPSVLNDAYMQSIIWAEDLLKHAAG
jgi:EAL and modified HD-GYP domain-containing signal transduction protein